MDVDPPIYDQRYQCRGLERKGRTTVMVPEEDGVL